MYRVIILVAALWAFDALAGCVVNSTTTLAFGIYDPFSTMPNDTAVGGVNITCSGVYGLVGISLGPGQSGDQLARKLKAGSNLMSYQIYFDLLRTKVMGDGTSGTWNYTGLVLVTGVATPFSFYGRIPARQAVAAGSYTDSVQITVSF
ncbi:MAG: spore coat U domain-containing protein [Archangium sp.]